ncbi:MAG: trypco2 family protein [Thermoanaerobaculia bacterium]
MRFPCAAAAVFSLLFCATSDAQTVKPASGTSLDSVLVEVQGALQRAQDVLAASSLPPLQSVQLILHTQAEKDATGKVTVLFISFGGGPSASASQELVLTLTPPKPRSEIKPAFVPPPTAADSIVGLIQAAAQAVRTAESGKPPLEAKSLTLDLAFTVRQAVSGGLQFDVGVVSANATGDVRNSSEQRIKITFGR